MKEKKHSDIQDDAYYDRLIKQRIGEALRNQSKEERLDMATLEAWVEADRQKRKARIKRGISIACCILILCVGTIGIKYAFDYDGSVAVAGKNDDAINESGNNVVIKNNEDDVDENVGNETVLCENWDSVAEAKKVYPELLVPAYMPDRYSLVSLQINENALIKKYKYIFSTNSEEIEIKECIGGEETLYYDYDRKIQSDKCDVLIIEDDVKTAVCKIGETSFTFIGNLTDREIIDILNGLS